MSSSEKLPDSDDADFIAASPLEDADDHDHDDHQDDSSPPPRKRSRLTSCASSAAVPAGIRRRVIASANSRCWLCSQHGKHVAHVIARSDTILFDEFRSTGLLHMDSLHSLENLIYLCYGCHGAFDERIPAWAFLPTPLTPFLTAELTFHAARAAAAASGVVLPRPPPERNPAPLVYARYQIRRGHVFTQVFRKKPTRTWAGNPVAAIIRSASVLMGVQRLDPVRRCGIPDEVAETLQRLLWLYATPPPEVVHVLGAAGTPVEKEQDSLGEEDSDDGDDGEEEEDEEDNEAPESPPKRRTTRTTNVGTAGQRQRQHQHQHRKHLLTAPLAQMVRRSVRPRKTDADDGAEEWVFGPLMTAGRIVDWYRCTRDAA